MTILSDMVLEFVAKEDWKSLQDLASRDLEQELINQAAPYIIRGVKELESICAQNTLTYKFSESHRKTMAALARFVGIEHVMFFCSEFPVINDPWVLGNLMPLMTKRQSEFVRNRAVMAVKAGQKEASNVLIDWLIQNGKVKFDAREMYMMYEYSANFDGKPDQWIFNRMDELGYVSEILKLASMGRIDIIRNFMNSVERMNGQQLRKTLQIFERN